MKVLTNGDRFRSRKSPARERLERQFGAKKVQESHERGIHNYEQARRAAEDGKDPNEAGFEDVRSDPDYRMPDHFDDCGLAAARIWRAMALCAYDNQNVKVKPDEVVRVLADVYGDKATANYLARSLETTKPEKGGMFVMPRFLMNEFVTYLRSFAPVFLMGARRIPLGSGFTIPGQANGANARWKGEKCYTRATKFDFNTLKFTTHEMEAKMCISEELLRTSEVDVDSLVREELMMAMAELLTATGFYGGNEPHSPTGIFNYPGIPVYSLPDADGANGPGGDITDTLPDLITALFMGTNIPLMESDTGSIMSHWMWYKYRSLRYPVSAEPIFQPEMNQGRIGGWPYSVWSGLEPYDTVDAPAGGTGTPFDNPYDLQRYVFGKWSDMIIATDSDNARMRASNDATFTDAEGNQCSAFDIGAVVIKANWNADIGFRRKQSFCIVDNIRCERFEEKAA